MAVLPRPVTIMMFWMPEWMASSTPYWMMGLSTIGSISLGCALVAGRNRVPRPAAGNTALRTLASIFYSVVRRGAQRQAVLVVRGQTRGTTHVGGAPDTQPAVVELRRREGKLVGIRKQRPVPRGDLEELAAGEDQVVGEQYLQGSAQYIAHRRCLLLAARLTGN